MWNANAVYVCVCSLCLLQPMMHHWVRMNHTMPRTCDELLVVWVGLSLEDGLIYPHLATLWVSYNLKSLGQTLKLHIMPSEYISTISFAAKSAIKYFSQCVWNHGFRQCGFKCLWTHFERGMLPPGVAVENTRKLKHIVVFRRRNHFNCKTTFYVIIRFI